MRQLSKPLKDFIANSTWIFAKTYATTWPHEYIVEDRINNELFLALEHHIDTYGHEEHFYDIVQKYYDYDGQTYWHMDNIINRCLEADTYERRAKEGKLPGPKI